jgi:hypothetical protein
MARLYLFAEGQTEQTFADTVLKPHLANFGVYLHGAVLIATSRKKGKVFRGGGRNYLPMKNDIQRFLKQEKGADVFFTTMIDLYAIHADMPGLGEAEKQLHEYEACLFVDVTQFGHFYEQADKQIAALKAVADDHDSPELIDDGPHTAPSKRIIGQFPDYEDGKPAVGPQVAELIGLTAIRAKALVDG